MIKENKKLKIFVENTMGSLLSSQFIYDSVNEIPKIKKIFLTIESQELKITHYMFLYLISNKTIPFIKRTYKSSKKSLFGNSTKIAKRFIVSLRKNQNYIVMNDFLKNLIVGRIATENTVLKIAPNYTKIILWDTPLTNKTVNLQSPTGFITNIPFGLNFFWRNNKNCTLYEKIFFLRTLGFIEPSEIDALDDMSYNGDNY